jgi:hypothetical protein
VRAPLRSGRFADHAGLSLSGGTLTVSLLRNGPHEVGIRTLDGRRVDLRRGTGRLEYRFANLRPGVYMISVTTGGQRLARLVTAP